MLQHDDIERQRRNGAERARQDINRQARIIKWQRVAIGILVFITAGLAASTAVLAFLHSQGCGASLSSSDGVSDTPQAPSVGRRSGGLVVVPVQVAGRTTPLYPSQLYPITNGTNITASPGNGQCEPGSVWGGQMLDHLNHGYMPLMQKALSVSPPGVAGEIRDYYHTSLRSVFRCGESMDFGQLELVSACKSGYVVEGKNVECDEGGSYGNSTSASA